MANSAADFGMIKHLLMTSMRKPVNCAIGYQSDSWSATILLDRFKSGKALIAELMKTSAQAEDFCYGTVRVDPDTRPKLVIFTINRRVPGMERRLKTSLHEAGFHNLGVAVEDGLVMDPFAMPTASSMSTASFTTTRIGA